MFYPVRFLTLNPFVYKELTLIQYMYIILLNGTFDRKDSKFLQIVFMYESTRLSNYHTFFCLWFSSDIQTNSIFIHLHS